MKCEWEVLRSRIGGRQKLSSITIYLCGIPRVGVECNTTNQTFPCWPFSVPIVALPLLSLTDHVSTTETPGPRNNSPLMASRTPQSLHQRFRLADIDPSQVTSGFGGRQRCRKAAMPRCPILREALHNVMADASLEGRGTKDLNLFPLPSLFFCKNI